MIKFNKKKILSILYATICIFSLSPYFLWNTYSYSDFFKGLYLLCYLVAQLLFLLLFVLNKHPFTLKSYKKVIFFLVFSICVTILYTSRMTMIGYVFQFLFILTFVEFLLCPNDIKKETINYFRIFFVITLIPSIIYMILNFISIEIPFSILETTHTGKATSGIFYIKYFGSVFIFGLGRLCGIYDEPGVVGTIGALLIALNSNQKDWKNLIIQIAGVLTFSLAFFVIFGIVIAFKKGMIWLKVLILISILIIVYNPQVEVNTRNDDFNKNINRLIQRFDYNDGLVGDNRLSDSARVMLNSYMKTASNSQLFVGNGWMTASKNQYLSGSYSYKFLIYDIGIVGFVLYLVWILYIGLFNVKKSKDLYLFLFLFCLSIYQRPYIISFHFLVLLAGSGIYIYDNKNNTSKIVNSA